MNQVPNELTVRRSMTLLLDNVFEFACYGTFFWGREGW